MTTRGAQAVALAWRFHEDAQLEGHVEGIGREALQLLAAFVAAVEYELSLM